jgi:UDPglucose 6-dehydrogenase
MRPNVKIGFIGQGFVGKNYADDFENRGYTVVRYSQETEYTNNKDLIKECDIVFVAVPTPTNKNGFDYSIVDSVLELVGKDKIVVIKSTLIPGTTRKLQDKYKDIIVIHSPEFLSEKTAKEEAANPPRNIIGIVEKNPEYQKAAELVLKVLPKAPFEIICSAEEAEIVKYGHNSLGFFRILFTNIVYDLAGAVGADWENIKKAMIADPENTPTYMNPVHKTGRGAGGNCFIKDFAAFRQSYEENVPDDIQGIMSLRALEQKNIDLLKNSKKDLDILRKIYD